MRCDSALSLHLGPKGLIPYFGRRLRARNILDHLHRCQRRCTGVLRHFPRAWPRAVKALPHEARRRVERVALDRVAEEKPGAARPLAGNPMQWSLGQLFLWLCLPAFPCCSCEPPRLPEDWVSSLFFDVEACEPAFLWLCWPALTCCSWDPPWLAMIFSLLLRLPISLGNKNLLSQTGFPL
ncbi:hypothetical protein ACVIEM_006889 [Rhizobium leguminosarum]